MHYLLRTFIVLILAVLYVPIVYSLSSQMRITAPIPDYYGYFGRSIAMSESLLIISDTDDATTIGSVYIYELDQMNMTYNLVSRIVTDDPTAYNFGSKVSLYNDTWLAIGAYSADCEIAYGTGAVYVYTIYNNNDGTWGYTFNEKIYYASSQQNDLFGTSVIIRDNYIMIGAISESNTGAVYIYGYDGISWMNTSPIRIISSTQNVNEKFGKEIEMIDTHAFIVAAPFSSWSSIQGAGVVYAYYDNGAREVIIEPNPATVYDRFGISLSLSNKSLAIGTLNEKVFIYKEDNSSLSWTQQYTLTITQTYNSYFGRNVYFHSPNIIYISTFADTIYDVTSTGSVYVFYKDTITQTWTEKVKLYSYDPSAYDYFGDDVSSSSSAIVITAHQSYVGSTSKAGYVYIYAPCDEITPCDVDYCNGGGCCMGYTGSPICDCIGTGKEGKYCEYDIDDCISSPCMNGGICNDNGSYSFICDCTGTGSNDSLCEINNNNDGNSSNIQVNNHYNEIILKGDSLVYYIIFIIGFIVLHIIVIWYFTRNKTTEI